MDDTHNEDPDKSKIAEAAAAVIILQKNYNGDKKFSLTEAVKDTGVFKLKELSKYMVGKVKAEMKIQGHRTKTSNRPSLGGLETPGQAKRWAAASVATTTTKGHFTTESYTRALAETGFDISVDEIRAEKKRLMQQKKRENDTDARPSKRPSCHSTTGSSLLQERTTATVPLLAVAAASSTPGLPAATATMASALEDGPTAMAPHSEVASTPGGFQGFDELDCATPQTAALGRRLDPIFEEQQDRPNPSQDFLAQQEPSRVYSRHELEKEALMMDTQDFLLKHAPSHVYAHHELEKEALIMDTFHNVLVPTFFDANGHRRQPNRELYSQFELEQGDLMMDTFHNVLVPAFFEPNGDRRQDIDFHKVETALYRLVDDMRGRAVARTTSVLNGKTEAEAIRAPAPLGPQVDPKKYPILSFFGVPLDDDRIISELRKEMWQMNRDITGSTTMHIDLGNEGNVSLVTIPRPKSSSLDELMQIQQRTGFLDEIAGALDPDGLVTDDSRRNLCTLLVTDKEYQPFFREIAQSEWFSTSDEFDEEETSVAIQKDAGINDSAARSLGD